MPENGGSILGDPPTSEPETSVRGPISPCSGGPSDAPCPSPPLCVTFCQQPGGKYSLKSYSASSCILSLPFPCLALPTRWGPASLQTVTNRQAMIERAGRSTVERAGWFWGMGTSLCECIWKLWGSKSPRWWGEGREGKEGGGGGGMTFRVGWARAEKVGHQVREPGIYFRDH